MGFSVVISSTAMELKLKQPIKLLVISMEFSAIINYVNTVTKATNL